MKRLKQVGAGLLAAGAGSVGAFAQTAPDASTITSTASTAFNAVGALVVTMVGFYIVVRIVKKIRG